MKLQEIEFVAGPLDGLTHRFQHSPDGFPTEIGLPINPLLVGLLSAEKVLETVDGPPTSVAIYRLEQRGNALRYRHVCSLAEEHYHVDDN